MKYPWIDEYLMQKPAVTKDFRCKLLNDYSYDKEHGDNPPGTRIENCKYIHNLLEK